jgi:lipoprotein-anchoring transpeptidase ErfK/SrfK
MRIPLASAVAAALATAALTTALTTVLAPAAASASAASARPGAVGSRAAAPAKLVRETVSYGDQDTSASKIQHVHELQYRLRCAGVYDGPVTGYFGDLTKAAVQRYQRRTDLPVSGIAGRATWKRLIAATIRGRADIPAACEDGTGWDACDDRTRHEVTLWHDGVLINAWLARGGAADHQTRTGDFTVYYRDIDHVSSLYDSPMPYSQFFSGGEAFHGSATMVDPFTGHSHGCINLYNEDARQLWNLTSRVRLAVHVHGAWS